ncbi:hypothetical protein AB0H73_18480 [Streptomyces olivoreticuli]|uniref:hypothetical protein n=1 Tax=Streptomyces olivoreticuli TaxID=68246 RepID=UPI000E25E512|nr:hypothetical protein [Streptomyces olivoreticuli]
MPTPYGTRGGMAFSADELRVLRRALAIALDPQSVPRSPGPERDEEVRECLRLAESVDEAAHEGGRLRAFLLADLIRYRAALPGTAAGYTERLQNALSAGYQPRAEDLKALRTLCAGPSGGAEADRRRALLHRCEHLAELGVRARLADRSVAGGVPMSRPEPRARLLALAGGRAAGATAIAAPEARPDPKPAPKPEQKPAPSAPAPKSPRPDRPIPTPGEVFPPRRKVPPPSGAEVADPRARPA